MALSFNGIDQYLQQSSVVTGVPVSFACWYQPADLSVFRGPISIGSKTANNGLFLLTQTSQKLRADSHANNISSFSDSAASLSNGVWFHCVSVFASATSRVNYLNGVASTVNSVSSVPVGLTTLSVGAIFAGSTTASVFASGLVAYPAVWNTTLSPTDVSTLYNSGSGSDPNSIETANLRSFSYLQGLPYVDTITATPWTVTGSPVVVADPFTLTPPTTSVFPVSIDSFKRIPNPTTTATNIADATDDTLSTRLQKHSDSIVSTQTWLLANSKAFYATDTGAANAYVVTLSNPPIGYVIGMTVTFNPSNSNTGASVISVNSLGSVSILNPAGNALNGGEIQKNAITPLVFDGTGFRIFGNCALGFSLTTPINQTFTCAGYTSIGIIISYTGTGGFTATLSNVSQGAVVILQVINNSGVTNLVQIIATNASGASVTVVQQMISGSSAGTANSSLNSGGVTLTSGLGITFIGSLVTPTLLLFSR